VGSEGVAAAPKTVVSAVAEDGARARKSKGKKVKEANATEVAAGIWPMSPDAVF
jgi:hypothetical protein